MFKIKYNTGISDRQVTFVDPFKRLDYCKAAYYHKTHVSEKHNKNGHSYTIHTYAFVSYETPICRIKQYIDNVTHDDFSTYTLIVIATDVPLALFTSLLGSCELP